jgi:hypothetical protein
VAGRGRERAGVKIAKNRHTYISVDPSKAPVIWHFGAKMASGLLAQTEIALTTQSNEAARAKAEASFKKEERAKEGAKAMLEYQTNSRMIREKTERLRALRLAKQATDRAG